jgi:hypothetical protein
VHPSTVMSLALCLMSASAFAADEPDKHRPPEEALTACKGKTADSACTFNVQQAQLTGTCRAPQGRPLACVPSDAVHPAFGGTGSQPKGGPQ